MSPRGAAMLASIAFIVLLAVGSYLLDVPMSVVSIAVAFAVAVILWLGSRSGPRAPR